MNPTLINIKIMLLVVTVYADKNLEYDAAYKFINDMDEESKLHGKIMKREFNKDIATTKKF